MRTPLQEVVAEIGNLFDVKSFLARLGFLCLTFLFCLISDNCGGEWTRKLLEVPRSSAD
jgi:hypothetical protein